GGGLWLEGLKKIGGALCVRGGAENRAFVLFQDVQPVAQIGGVIVPDFRRNPEVGAQESRAQFGNQFLGGVTVIAKTLGVQAPVKAALVAGPVRQLVQRGCVIDLGVPESWKWGH